MNMIFKKIYYKTDSNCIFFTRISAFVPIVMLMNFIKIDGGIQLDTCILFFLFNINYFYSLNLLFDRIHQKCEILYHCGAGRREINLLFVKYSVIEYVKGGIFALILYKIISRVVL